MRHAGTATNAKPVITVKAAAKSSTRRSMDRAPAMGSVEGTRRAMSGTQDELPAALPDTPPIPARNEPPRHDGRSVAPIERRENLEAIRLSKAPVIASHSAVRALADVSRNMDDEQLLGPLKEERRRDSGCRTSLLTSKSDSKERRDALAKLNDQLGRLPSARSDQGGPQGMSPPRRCCCSVCPSRSTSPRLTIALATIPSVRGGMEVFVARSAILAGPAARPSNKPISFAAKRCFAAINPIAIFMIRSGVTSAMDYSVATVKARYGGRN